mgnify:FL=1
MSYRLPRVLPPVVFLILLLLLVPLELYHPTDFGELRGDRELPWDVMLPIGLILLLGARAQFSKNNSEINTFETPRNLITSGLFRLSRNPMYMGFLFVLLAAAFYVNTACALLAPLAFFIAANWWYIPHEEFAARKTFGSDYEKYTQRVRRWL